MAAAVALAERELGGLDALVAVAGVIAGGVPLWEMPPEQQEAVLDANLRSVLVASRVGIPALLRRPEPRAGRFVAVASAAATRGLAAARRLLRREGGRHRPRARAGRRAARDRGDGERRQPRLDRDARSSTRAPGCTASSRRRRSRRSSRSRA